MNIDSAGFVLFCTLLLLGVGLIGSRLRKPLLLIASYGFYATWSLNFLWVLVGVTGLNFLLARHMRGPEGPRSVILWFGILINLLVLAGFRYADFFVPEFLTLLARWGYGWTHGIIPVLIPVGLSFYILQTIAYLVDVYRGQCQDDVGLLDFALYLSWFPKLTAGPIERAAPFLRQLANLTQRDIGLGLDAIKTGLTLVLLGLVRKLVIADTLLRAVPDELHTDPASLSALMLIVWLIVYAVGLYNDFAGYTDMARGVSRLYGIELSRNFSQPLLAHNYAEFWGRWHITLSTWLRDYIYFPVSRYLLQRYPDPRHPVNRVLPPVVTMAASGWWHGTGISFLLWGLMMGFYQVIERLFLMNRPVIPFAQRPWWSFWPGWLLTQGSFLFALPFFLASVEQALLIWQQLFTPAAWSEPLDPHGRVVLMLIPSLWLDWVQRRGKDELVFLQWSRPVRIALTTASLLAVFLFTRLHQPTPFIYQGF